MTTLPLITIITVNYNQPEVTLELIASLGGLDYANWELIVVDNGSSQPITQDQLKSNPKIKLVSLSKNRGFAGGNNAALEQADGDYLLFINNDTEVKSDLLSTLYKLFLEYPNLGIVSPKLKFFGTNTIQFAGSTHLSPFTMRNSTRGSREEDTGEYNDVIPTAYAHGAAMMIKREVLDVVGPMWEDYFLYYEELDWSARIEKAGFDLLYCGETEVYHKESISTGINSPLKIYYLTRNRLLFARRNFGGINKLVTLLYCFFLVSIRDLIKWSAKRRFDLVGAVLRANMWNLKNLGRA